MPRMKGADVIIEYLIDGKIPYVFGLCGHGNVGILDSLYEARDRITLVSPRHEQVAAHMADAYFRVRHEAVATLTSCGPGSDGCFTMVPHVLCTAVEYNIPVVWLIWNNFGWASIRDIQLGMFGGREHGTMFHEGANNTPYNPDFAAWARAAGVEAITVTRSQDLKGALEHAVRANKPFVLDVHVDAEVRPPSTGAWQLPPTPYKEPVFGKRYVPDAAPAK